MKKIALVTGASSQLGSKIIEVLAANSFKVYAGSRDVKDITKEDNITPIKLDITKDSDVQKAVREVTKKEGKIDVLVNCAGVTLVGPTIDFTPEDFQKILGINTIGTFRLIREVVPYMIKQKHGYIINITSLNGLVALPNFGLYCASKYALEALGLSLRYELASNNVWVTNIAPGAIYSSRKVSGKMPHKPAREKFKILYYLMPMVTTDTIARKVLKLVQEPKPPARVVLGADAIITTNLQRILPLPIWDLLVKFVWGKK